MTEPGFQVPAGQRPSIAEAVERLSSSPIPGPSRARLKIDQHYAPIRHHPAFLRLVGAGS